MTIPEQLGWDKLGSGYQIKVLTDSGFVRKIAVTRDMLVQLDEISIERIPAIIAGGKVFHDDPYKYLYWDHPVRLAFMLKFIIRPYLAQRMVD